MWYNSSMGTCVLCLKNTDNKYSLCFKCFKKYNYSKRYSCYYKRKDRGRRSYWKTQKMLGKTLKMLYPSKTILEEVYFTWSKSPTGALLQYDFYIPEFRILIELNGEQHYYFTPAFHKNKTEFYEQIVRDRIKEENAKDSGFIFMPLSFNDCVDIKFLKNKIDGAVYQFNKK